MGDKKSRVLIVFYNDPERYPPTLNVIRALSVYYDEVVFIGRKFGQHYFDYPKNVSLKFSEGEKPNRKGLLTKMSEYQKFFKIIVAEIRDNSPTLILTQDGIALFVLYLVKKVTRMAAVHWHHVHDIFERGASRYFSIAHLSILFEAFAMRKVDFLSTPSMERLQYMSLSLFSGKTLFLPNYPSLSFLKGEKRGSLFTGKCLKLIYQGRLGRNHGFESLIDILGRRISGYGICMTLIGPIDESYKRELFELAGKRNKLKYLKILDPIPYSYLMKITEKHDIGLAIHRPTNIIYTTGGTASNKIYEYVACGMPVLLHDNIHYRKILGSRKWSFFTNLEKNNLINTLEDMVLKYQMASEAARADFCTSLNFESAFKDFYAEMNYEG